MGGTIDPAAEKMLVEVIRMMGANGLGDPQEKAFEYRAYWWKRTSSGKRIWPGQKYVIVKTYFDAMGRPPIHNLSWDRIYTPNEYLVRTLKNEAKVY